MKMNILSPKAPAVYSVGTLRYNLAQLLLVSWWVLLGVFWYDMVQYILVPTLMPVTFKALGASGEWIGVVLGSIPAAANFLLNPIISTASDRTRTKYGRRIPYMLISVPFVTGFCLLLGWLPEWSDVITGWFRRIDGKLVLLLVYSTIFILFQVSGLVIGILSCYLAPDVIPSQFIGRFQICKGLVGNGAGFLFNFILMRYVEGYAKWIYTGLALLFALCFTLLCVLVKEGEYPPPELPEKGKPWMERLGDWFRLYFRECFGQKFFLLLFLGFALTNVSTICRGHFNILFATHDLALSTAQYGEIMSYGNLMSLAVLFMMMPLIDRLNPLLLYLFTGIAVLGLNVWGYFIVNGYTSFLVVGLLMVFVYTMQSLSSTPMLIMLLPRDKFGQFSSAAMMVTCFGSVLGSWLCGIAVDHFGYRYIYVWDFIFTLAASVVLIEVWRRCRKNKQEARA